MFTNAHRGNFYTHITPTPTPCDLTFLDAVSNWLGSMPGKSFRATGRRNSMNGTMMKTEKGTSLNRSEAVRVNCIKERTRYVVMISFIDKDRYLTNRTLEYMEQPYLAHTTAVLTK